MTHKAEALEALALIAAHANQGGQSREDALAGLARISKRSNEPTELWTPEQAESWRRIQNAKFLGGTENEG